MTGYFDTHAHLLDKRFDDDRFEVIKNTAGIVNIVEPGEDGKILDKLLEEKKVWAAAGIHPHAASRFSEKQELLKKLLSKDKVVALGEIGLDFYYNNSEPEVQKEIFKKQLAMAEAKKLPVIIHSRSAFSETIDILDNYSSLSVLIHCFTGSRKELAAFLERDYYIAIGGVVTFPKADELRAAAAEIPADRLLLETDSPYLAPRPVRGKRNSPENVKYIAARMARLSNRPVKEVIRITYYNALDFFNIR
ncbi:MAG: TatD family hydrolase [Elusimicrobiota bacterium]|nr:TatD family hydrolase [Elusimicrobiota bacterium]